MSRWTLVLTSRAATNGLSESTLCATATVSTFLPAFASACWGAGLSGVTRPTVRVRAAAPAAARRRRTVPFALPLAPNWSCVSMGR
jgi:hypothetical protein